MKEVPCKVCGSTDLNLIDGYYYCVECGTQDANVRETVIERTFLADGTSAFQTKKKFATIIKDGIEMSGEWYKWHAYNFILDGLTEELIKLGAKPTVKLKILWIWTRYIKKFQIKEDLEGKSIIGENFSQVLHTPTDSDTSESEDDHAVGKKKQYLQFFKDVKIFTKGLLLAILYLGLNFDKSHIQLSHLLRFMKEGRLSLLDCTKYIPKEIDTKSITHWESFLRCQSEYNSHTIRSYAMACIKTLDLGFPVVPNFNKIIDSYVKELCLPKDFKDLVFSLMHYHPLNNVELNKISLNAMVRLPDYENVAMSYVLVALKMCFGLDGDYEIKQSEVIDGINNKENYLKSYKSFMCSEPTNRLFSFNEWTRFLQFRKTILCKHYLPIARQHNYKIDDYVLMEQLEERSVRPMKLRDEVTMDILNKIPYKKNINVIPKTEFTACLTPMSNYTDVIVNYILDTDIRLVLSEDFTQYNLKYASQCTKISDMKGIQFVGVSEVNKVKKATIEGNFKVNQGDMSMVFVRNCENKNWLKTNPPTAAHVTKTDDNESNDRDSDQGYASTIENTPTSNAEDINDNKEVREVFEEENEYINIFDDNFEINDNFKINDDNFEINDDHFKINDDNFEINDDKSLLEPVNNMDANEFNNEQFNENNSEDGSDDLNKFDPNNFDRTKLIEELIAMACVKYKIPNAPQIPRQQRKRVAKRVHLEAGESAPKRKRTTRNTSKQTQINDMIARYFSHIENDFFTTLSKQIKNVIDSQNNLSKDAINNDVQLMQANEGTANDGGCESNRNFEQSENHHNSIANDSLCLNDVNNTVPGTDTLMDSDADENEDKDLASHNREEDPNFDTKTHNIKQLYVKVNEEFVSDDLVDVIEDPELDQIISDKIGDNHQICDDASIKNVTKCDTFYSDSDEDVINVEECRKLGQKRGKSKTHFKPLIKRPLKIKEFKYWLRHYVAINKNLDMHNKFDLELDDNFPASFNFVIRECAAILNSSTFSLYKGMQKLEEHIMKNSTSCEPDDCQGL